MEAFRIADPEIFDTQPEFAMGVHIARLAGPTRQFSSLESDDVFIVFNGSLAVSVQDAQIAETPLPFRFFDAEEQPIPSPGLIDRELQRETYIWAVAEEPIDVEPCENVELVARKLCMADWSLARLRRHGRVHGSPPFPGQSRAGQRYVRFSRFVRDRRVTPGGGLLPGTFATSALDADMVPTALTAVGHYALPSIAPPVYRFTIVPPPSTDMYYGTVSPAFGQSGGGTEIEFHRGVSDGAVSEPLMLPYL